MIYPQPIRGMALGTFLKVLIRNGFAVDLQHLGRIIDLVMFGVLNSVLGGADRLIYGQMIRDRKIASGPLFILGHWRCGTTHLQNLLNLDQNFISPTAFQATFPHCLNNRKILKSIFDRIAPRKRPMDNMVFGCDVPHEDEFALVALTGISPYIRALFPITGNSRYEALDPEAIPPEALEEWKKSFLFFLKMVACCSNGERLLLKSPTHLGRVHVLLELFPDAQFVHIVRNPYTVFLSSRRLWQDLFSYSHLQTVDQDLVDEIILSWHVEMYSLFERDRRLIPRGALHEIRFEDLEAMPIKTLKSIYNCLNLCDFDMFADKAANYLESIREYKKNEYHLDAVTRAKVAHSWKWTFEKYGYPF